MTRQELPNLLQNFLDKGIPAPIGLIYDSDILNIGLSHQVVAYGYSMSGTTLTIYIYDNRYHDDECTLVLDASNPGTIVETSLTKGKENWAGLLVSDGYQPQWPSRPGYQHCLAAVSPAERTSRDRPNISWCSSSRSECKLVFTSRFVDWSTQPDCYAGAANAGASGSNLTFGARA